MASTRSTRATGPGFGRPLLVPEAYGLGVMLRYRSSCVTPAVLPDWGSSTSGSASASTCYLWGRDEVSLRVSRALFGGSVHVSGLGELGGCGLLNWPAACLGLRGSTPHRSGGGCARSLGWCRYDPGLSRLRSALRCQRLDDRRALVLLELARADIRVSGFDESTPGRGVRLGDVPEGLVALGLGARSEAYRLSDRPTSGLQGLFLSASVGVLIGFGPLPADLLTNSELLFLLRIKRLSEALAVVSSLSRRFVLARSLALALALGFLGRHPTRLSPLHLRLLRLGLVLHDLVLSCTLSVSRHMDRRVPG